jgi:hypothetical protein
VAIERIQATELAHGQRVESPGEIRQYIRPGAISQMTHAAPARWHLRLFRWSERQQLKTR